MEEEEDEEDIDDQREKATGLCCSGDERGDNSFVNISEQTDTTVRDVIWFCAVCVCVILSAGLSTQVSCVQMLPLQNQRRRNSSGRVQDHDGALVCWRTLTGG